MTEHKKDNSQETQPENMYSRIFAAKPVSDLKEACLHTNRLLLDGVLPSSLFIADSGPILMN